ncbi:MAG TPA: hypothetical protein ENH82_02600 [bacterium]|nr:hypothetical protein [bacterium]
MKTKKLIIEAQQICLEAATEVFNFLEIAFTDMEKDECFSEEPTLALKPYNDGYQIVVQAYIDYRKIHIQPNNFFEQYMEKGKNARIEYSHFFKGHDGYTSKQIDVSSIDRFKIYAKQWVELIKREIESIESI